ncbi:hypothetical protein BU23DRAFT_601608 [Bimuria novae-zelandiae CBS 107.79]|uniref:Uncharacterized protein n=1 Tax=Bimuria novae-zelandiae CBS 107.79 TaxID=1447943 RepID=A0A6A5UYA6_9PLEO|nr:hypothetical protein BU23DRAFT_601608 [Bimuria novae-zelandiae CBS 107.79]
MRFLSLLAVGCGLVFAAVLPEDPAGLDRDLALEEAWTPALEEAWSLAQVTEFTGNVTALLEEEVALQEATLQDRSLEKRKCFKTGAKWGHPKQLYGKAAVFACYNKLSGTYKRGQVYRVCGPVSNSMSVEFKLGLTGKNAPKTRYISGGECLSGMSSEINSCSRGGQTTYGNWYYRVDPNKGGCP